jgi:hypothetical protein
MWSETNMEEIIYIDKGEIINMEFYESQTIKSEDVKIILVKRIVNDDAVMSIVEIEHIPSGVNVHTEDINQSGAYKKAIVELEDILANEKKENQEDELKNKLFKWISEAVKISEKKLTIGDFCKLEAIAMKESDGNPKMIKMIDTNYHHDLYGLMGLLDSTFNKYSVKGHEDIFNAVDNILAGINYSYAEYGKIPDINEIKDSIKDIKGKQCADLELVNYKQYKKSELQKFSSDELIEEISDRLK